MNFLRYRAEHLADFLREALASGKLVEPLPGARAWSQQLGVSRATLTRALRDLEREKLLIVTRQGVQLKPVRRRRAKQSLRLVRALYDGREYPQWQSWRDWPTLLAERLRAHQIQIVVERCDSARFQAILGAPSVPGELLLLSSLSAQYQRLFAQSGKPSVIVGSRATGVALPSVTVDQESAITHATQWLLRSGRQRVTLVCVNTRAPGIRQAVAVFEAACRQWPHQPVRQEVVLMPRRFSEQLIVAHRLAGRTTPGQGFIVTWPVPTSLIMTALLQRGLTVPHQAQLIAMLTPTDSLALCPLPIHYPFPQSRFIKTLAEIAIHYYETGRVPLANKLLAVEMARA